MSYCIITRSAETVREVPRVAGPGKNGAVDGVVGLVEVILAAGDILQIETERQIGEPIRRVVQPDVHAGRGAGERIHDLPVDLEARTHRQRSKEVVHVALRRVGEKELAFAVVPFAAGRLASS
jgi:hypothetical protein